MINFFKSPKITSAKFGVLILLVLASAGYLVFYFVHITNVHQKNSEEATQQEQVDDQQYSPFASMLLPLYSVPASLRIESSSVNISVNLLPLGLDSNGVLETPQDWGLAGWYAMSAMPGEKGNIIIDGHYDDNRGRPAAFWELKNVKSGDKVSITDVVGNVYDYIVNGTFFVSINDPERLGVFDSPADGESVMTLITCGGVWIPGQSTYNQRLVVKAELINNL